MPDGAIPLFVSLLVLIGFSALFSATETAYTCASRIKLKSLFENGNKRAGKVLHLTEKSYDKLLSTILIGNNIVNLSASTVCALLFAKLLANSNLNSSVVSTVAVTIAVLIFGEITPKYIGKACAEKFALLVYPVISVLILIFYPLNVLFSWWKKLIVKIFRFDSKNVITEEEIITMVKEAENDGTIKSHETNLILNGLEFDDLSAKDILVPRVNIFAAEINASKDEIRRKFDESGFSRLPVFDGEIDKIIGILHEKDFYKNQNFEKKIEDLMTKPFFATEKMKISTLLLKMKKERSHMAIILDEYGGTLGLVTMEDILEQLVGEIYDEHDEKSDENHEIKSCGENSFILSGDIPVHKILKFFDIKDDEPKSNTLSGLITETLGDFPEVGRKINFHEKLEFEILETGGNKVQKIKAKKLNLC